jgi:hypothetical protein
MKTEKDKFNVHVKGKYKNFEDFLDRNKDLIYGGVIDSFKELLGSRKRKIKYTVNATVKLDTNEIVEWKTEFLLVKNEPDILVEHIMPHFEEQEDYEKCSEILNLHKELTNKEK